MALMLQSINSTLNTCAHEHAASFLIEPMPLGHGITVANALRRCMLADTSSAAPLGARINNLQHEFMAVQGIKEDTVEILLNIKKMIFATKNFWEAQRITNPNMSFESYSLVDIASICATGPKLVTAGLFKLKNKGLKIINSKQHICTILDNSTFYCEVDVKFGGVEDTFSNKLITIGQGMTPKTFKIDSNFCAVIGANYKIRLINDSSGALKEAIVFDIITNGSKTPKRVLCEAACSAIALFLPILSSENLASLSGEYLNELF